MKGDLLMTFVVVVVIAIAVLLIWYLWLQLQKGTVDIVAAQNILRNCCTDRSRWDCDMTNLNVNCNVPWNENPETLQQVATRAQIDLTDPNALCNFCNCQTCS